MSRSIRDLLEADLAAWRIGRKLPSGERENAMLSMYCNRLPRFLMLPLQPAYGLELRYFEVVKADGVETLKRYVKQYQHRDLYGDPNNPKRYPDLLDTVIGGEVWEPMAWYRLASWGLDRLYPTYEALAGKKHACQHRVNALYLDVIINQNASIAA